MGRLIVKLKAIKYKEEFFTIYLLMLFIRLYYQVIAVKLYYLIELF